MCLIDNHFAAGDHQMAEVFMDDREQTELVKYTKALLLAQLQAHTPPEQREKPEILMSRAGFVAREIAELLGKNPAAVAKTIQRAGKAA